MRHTFLRGIRLSGLILLITVGLLSIDRRSPSSAYWIFASEKPPSTTLFDTHQILDSNFHPHHRSQVQGEFIRWSPDADYYFVRFEGLVSGQEPGIYRFHTATGHREYLLPTASVPHSLDMELSPDGDAFLVNTPMYRDGLGGLYVLRPDGQIVYQIDKDVEVGSAQWSRDGQWVEFLALTDGQWLSYRIKPDGSHLEETEPPQSPNLDNDIRLLMIGLEEDELPVIGKLRTSLRNLPDDQQYIVHRWLPNRWFIARTVVVTGRGPRIQPHLYRVRMDGSDLSIIFEDELGRDPDVIDWEDDGNILYVAVQGDTNSLFRVDMVSGDVRMLIEDYQPVRSNCFDDSEVTCPPVHLDGNFEWVSWRTTDDNPVYKITSIETGESNVLYHSDDLASQEISMISPDNRWLYVSYVDLQSRDCVIKRISIGDRRIETKNGLCLVALSPVIDLPVHSNMWLFIGLISLSLSFAEFIYQLRMTDPQPAR